MKENYSYKDMKRAFECGRNFQLTGEDNFNELIEEMDKGKFWVCNNCNSSEYTLSISEYDIRQLGCSNCGENEFHKIKQ